MLLIFLPETNYEIVSDVNALMRCKLPWWPIHPKCAQLQMYSIMQHILLLLHFNPYIHAQTRSSECNRLQIFLQNNQRPKFTFPICSISKSLAFQCLKYFKKKVWTCCLYVDDLADLEIALMAFSRGQLDSFQYWQVLVVPRYQTADSTNLQFRCLL